MAFTLSIYNVRGRLVRELESGSRPAGTHRITWAGDDEHGRRVHSGVYFYRLETNGMSVTKRMVLIK